MVCVFVCHDCDDEFEELSGVLAHEDAWKNSEGVKICTNAECRVCKLLLKDCDCLKKINKK